MAVPDLKDAIEHLQRKDLDAAIAALERKIEELPAHLTAHVLLARTYEANHQWRKALTCWENVRFLMPNSPVGKDGKARTLRRLTREGDAADEPEETPPSAEAPAEPDAPPPAEADPEANAEEASSSGAPPDELQKLRRQAEAEARSGGARPDLAGEAPSSSAAADEPAPEDRVGQLEDEDDLDHLIEQLESARIEPDPDAEGDVPAPDLDDEVDDLVSETLARIHEAQDQYRKAAQIYLKLASQEPDRARAHLEKAAEMRKKADLDD